MSLRIVYGTSGTGKSTYIFQEIQEKLKELNNENNICDNENANTKMSNNENDAHTPNTTIKVITPEQFSFTSEQKLLEFSPSGSTLTAEVVTFNRMAHRILEDVGGKTRKQISSSGRAMLLDDILQTKKSDFTFLGKTEENVDMIANQITELKKHNVSTKTLKDIADNMQDIYLKKKLEDVYNIYDEYTSRIQNKYIDENDGLTYLADRLDETDEFKNCDIYLDEFAGFTLQEYSILRKLMRCSKTVTVTICTDNLNDNTTADLDMFYANKQTASRLIKIANEENVTIEEPVNLNNRKDDKQDVAKFRMIDNKDTNEQGQAKLKEKSEQEESSNLKDQSTIRFKSPDLKHLAESLEQPFYSKYDGTPSNISLFLANNPYFEIEHVAIEITKLVKEQGYRYEDIAIITKNLEIYGSLCKAIFRGYKIPVFMDEEKDLSENVFIKWLLALLDIFVKNWSYEAVIGYIKTGFTGLDGHEISMLTNYALKWGLKGSKWYAKEWKFYDENDEQKQIIIHAKEQIIAPLLEFKENLKGVKTVEQITKMLYSFIMENNIPNILEAKIIKLQDEGELERVNEYTTSWNIVMDLLKELITILGDEEITFERYSKILKMGFNSSHLGAIPGTSDQVIMGDTDRSRSHKVKAVFIIGLNDGRFPSNHKDEGFLDDKDRENLKEQGIELAKGTMEQLYDDNFNIYKAFTTAEERLYLSYVSSDAEGKSLRPSIMLNKIKRIFPNIHEESDVVERKSEILLESTTFDELLINLRKFAEGEEIDPVWFSVYKYYNIYEPEKLANSLKALKYKNIPEKLEKENLEKLYGNTLKTSVSKLEKYEACSFSYYLKYGLKIKEQSTFELGAIDTGSFMHDVIDNFFTYAEENDLKIKELSEEQIKEITDEIVENKLKELKYDIYQSVPKYKVLVNRLKKVVTKSMIYIVNSLKYSEFEVLGHEVEFNEGKEYKPITLELEDGKKVEITGKIDRIDIAKTLDGNYIRIIDYKSSAKNIDLNQVFAGLQLQLLTYLDATCKIEDMLPAGALYFPLLDPIIKGNKEMEENDLKKELQKQFKMKGLILADVDIVKKMDTNLEIGYSSIVSAQITKEQKVSDRQNVLKKEQFESLQNYMEKIIKQISNEILNGNIEIKPYYLTSKKTPCEYCEYKSICQFNKTTKNDYRYIANDKKEEVLEKMRAESY